MGYPLLPSLKANFTLIPQVFIESIFEDSSVSRSELITSLFCFNQSFRWHGGQMVIHFQLVSEKTGLTESEAEAGLAEAHKRNTLILLPGDQATGAKKLYMLNLPDNKQFVETYYTNSSAENSEQLADDMVTEQIVTDHSGETIAAEVTPVVTEESKQTVVNQVDQIVPDDTEPVNEMFDYDQDDEMIPFEDEVVGFEEEVVGYEDEPLPIETSNTYEDAPLPTETPEIASTEHVEPRAIEFNEGDDKNSSGYLPPGMSLPYHKKTVDMIGKMLGRSLSKVETERLSDLGADDQNLIEAMSSLLSKTTKVYSSDLIVYEYEQIESNKRTSSRYETAKVNRLEQVERQSNCMKCGGLGYIFQGLNNIHECDCKK